MIEPKEESRRWRLILGGGEADVLDVTLSGRDARMDATMEALYDSTRKGGLGPSHPTVARWLADVRELFPASVVRVIQRDAIERLDLKKLLMEPETLETLTPDVHLAATLIALSQTIPAKARQAAREIVARVVEDLTRRLAPPARQAVAGALRRAGRTRRPRPRDIDWHATLRANLHHYQPGLGAVIPRTFLGHARATRRHRHVILCLDQSGSMADSVIHAGVLASILASMPTVMTSVLAFDTNVVDLSHLCADPVELLFGVQLGGGTDIALALACAENLVACPSDTILVVLSDLFEGGPDEQMLARFAALNRAGVCIVALLALSDSGAPAYDQDNAAALAEMGIAAFACTPDLFAPLMAAAIERRDLARWAGEQGIATACAISDGAAEPGA